MESHTPSEPNSNSIYHGSQFPPPPPPPEEMANFAQNEGQFAGEGHYLPPPPPSMPGYPPPPGGMGFGFYPPPPGMMGYYPPPPVEKLYEAEPLPKNNTVYMKNLNTQIKLLVMKQSIENVFSQYGKILEVHMKKNFRLRGQAFIVFDSEESADKAIKTMDGAIFFQKPLKLNYARKVSDIIAKRKGKFNEIEEKSKREDNNLKYKEWIEYIRCLRAQEKLNKLKNEQLELMSQNDRKKEISDAKLNELDASLAFVSAKGDTANNVLFVKNVPGYVNQINLHSIFSRYPGFRELRLSSSKDSATVYYSTAPEASMALMCKYVLIISIYSSSELQIPRWIKNECVVFKLKEFIICSIIVEICHFYSENLNCKNIIN